MRAVSPPTYAGTLLGAALGAAFLLWLSGSRPIDPTNVEWVMKLDWVPHFFGWHYFRSEPWHWPPGTITGYYAPLGSSIGLTDAIPLAAYALKPFAAWLPPMFQYLGLWWLLCFALQGALGARLAGRSTSNLALQGLGAALFVLLPTLLARIGHAALCSHWLVLWALLIATRPHGRPARPWEWGTLGLVAGMVQPYLAAMVLPLLAAAALDRRATAPASRMAALAAAVSATVAGWWLSGLFVLAGEDSLGAGGLGYYSMNLLAPITPGGWSRFLPEIPVAGDGQTYEGFQYLGLGVLGLMAAALILGWTGRGRERRAGTPPAPRFGPVTLGVCVLMTAFAVSPRVTLGSLVLVDLSGPWFAPLAAFRSSGRFVWPLVYVALTCAVAAVVRHTPARAAIALLTAAVSLQLLDLHDAHAARRRTARDAAFYAWTQPFTSEQWPAVLSGYDHLALVPPPQCGPAPLPYEAVVRLAATHGLSVNAGVIARGDDHARAAYCEALDASVDAGRLDARTLYLMHDAGAQELSGRARGTVTCGVLDGVSMCAVAGSAAEWPPVATRP